MDVETVEQFIMGKAKQSKAKQSKAKQSKAKQDNLCIFHGLSFMAFHPLSYPSL
jgi:hypothetical protein